MDCPATAYMTLEKWSRVWFQIVSASRQTHIAFIRLDKNVTTLCQATQQASLLTHPYTQQNMQPLMTLLPLSQHSLLPTPGTSDERLKLWVALVL